MTEDTRSQVERIGHLALSRAVLVVRIGGWLPLRPWRAALALLGMLLLGAAGAVGAEEAADAPLPEITPKELASRLRAAWAPYDRGLLEVTFETTANTNWRFMMNRGTAAEQEPILVRFPGRARFLGDGVRWRVEYDSMMTSALAKKLNPQRWTSGFDGQQLYGWDVTRNEVTYGEAVGGAEGWRPRHQFWHEGELFAAALEQPSTEENPHAITIGQRTMEGVRCYVVERAYPRWGERTEEVISPRQGYLPLQTTRFRKGKPYHLQSMHGVHAVIPGFWAPDRIVEESRSVHDDGAEQLDRRTESRVVVFEPGKTFAAEAFAFATPYGVDVTDRRLGYSFHNDPWWPEMGKLLRERFDWPKSDLSPLRSLGSPAKFDGRLAPPIAAAAWINSGPLDLAGLKGKVVLLEFWGTWCPPCREKIPALRTLYETYHPAGLEMISIHTPTEDVEEVRRFAQEYRMTYPIAIDTAGADGGVTSHAYGVTGYPCALLVDHEGNVHTVGEPTPEGGQLLETLLPLLEKAGAKAKDMRSIALEHPRLSDAMETAVARALPQWIDAAPKQGVIRGRIVDGQGRPIAGAKLTGTLRLTLLIFASPGGYQLVDSGRGFAVSAGADGRFETTGLTRGMYALKVEAPGRAWREQDVPLGPGPVSAELEITLDQADTIFGLVRDPDGRPIAGATIHPAKWHHRTPGGGEVFTTPSGASAVRSDAGGLYRLQPLRHGSYTLEVTAPGFKNSVLEAVPAGTASADVTLQAP